MTKPLLMGVLNVTPDSFSDGGLHFDTETAIAAGLKMAEDGADWIDVGGESTRPGAESISNAEEQRRILPVISTLSASGLKVSADTRHPIVAEAALAAGAQMINDVSGLRAPQMIEVCAAAKCQVVIMHMLGEPQTMQQDPQYGDVVSEVRDYLVAQAAKAEQGGILGANIWVDPGIGFGKTVAHNLGLIRRLPELVATGYPVLIGASRKSFLGKVANPRGEPLPANERLEATLAVHTLAQSLGARMIRAHDVQPARRAIDTAAAILSQA